MVLKTKSEEMGAFSMRAQRRRTILNKTEIYMTHERITSIGKLRRHKLII